MDLVVAHFDSPFEMVSVRLGRGDGTFGKARIYPTPSPLDLAVEDLNQDGRPDLAVASYGAGTVSCLLNQGGGQFRQAASLPAGQTPYSLALADFNGDGWPDAAVADLEGHHVSVMINRGRENRRPPIER